MVSSRKRSGLKRKGSRKGRKFSRKTKISRTPRRMGFSDVHHFRETINAGQLIYPVTGSQTQTNSTGALIMRLTDLPIYQNLGSAFEFARLNACIWHILPKANMQLNQLTVSTSALATASPSGTLVTAVDQIPIYGNTNTALYSLASTWSDDSSNDTGVTSASFVAAQGITTSYIRGLQGSRETELYKKQRRKFFPAFYDYIMSPSGTGTITNVENPHGTFVNNGCVERKIKRWVSLRNVVSTNAGGSSTAQNAGPLYFGPLYALVVNEPSTSATPLFDMRLTYSVSFKRVVGS